MSKTMINRFARNRRDGVAAAEMAVSLPVLLVFAFGVMELTNAIYLQQSLEICAYEGARISLLPDTTIGNVEASCDKLLQSRGIKGATVSVSPSDFGSKPYGTAITVSVVTKLSKNLVTPMFVLSDKTLTGDVTMMKER